MARKIASYRCNSNAAGDDAVRRRRQSIEAVRRDVDGVDVGERRAELRRQLLAGRRVDVLAQQAARQRLAVDPPHDEEFSAQRIVAEKHRRGRGHA